MAKNLALLCAFLAALTLQADISLKNVALPQAFLQVQTNQKAAKGSLADKIHQQKLSAPDADENLKAAKNFENICPPEVRDTLQLVAVLGGSAEDYADLTDNPANAKFILGFYSPASLKTTFDMIPMLSMLKPELAPEPIKVAGYNGYKIKATPEGKAPITLAMVISKDQKTVLLAPEAILKAAIAAPAPLSPILQAARDDFANDMCAIAAEIPQEHRKSLEELLADSSLDQAQKNALKGIKGIALRFGGDATTLDVRLQASVASAEEAKLLKESLLDVMVVPMAQQLLPSLLPGANFPQTIKAEHQGATLALAVSLNEADLNLLAALGEDSLPDLLDDDDDED